MILNEQYFHIKGAINNLLYNDINFIFEQQKMTRSALFIFIIDKKQKRKMKYI